EEGGGGAGLREGGPLLDQGHGEPVWGARERARDTGRAMAVGIGLDDRVELGLGQRADRARVADDRRKVDLDPGPPNHRAGSHFPSNLAPLLAAGQAEAAIATIVTRSGTALQAMPLCASRRAR